MVRVLIAGGGVAALEATLALQALAPKQVEVELLAPEPHFSYRALTVAEPFGAAGVSRFDLHTIAGEVGARLTSGALASVDAKRHTVQTKAGAELGYDALVIACGARPRRDTSGALVFGSGEGGSPLRDLLAEIEDGSLRSIAFVVPGGVSWSLPLYELALLTAAHLEDQGIEDVELTLVTPEQAPLEVFGSQASEATRELLAEKGIVLQVGKHVAPGGEGTLRLIPEGALEVDRIVTLPRLVGPSIGGVKQTPDGFVPTDAHGRVADLPDVYAAGDITAFPVKQGGIAAQQADAVAEAIAARAGAEITPTPFEPVLRGLLLTGGVAEYFRAELGSGHGDTSRAATDALWWPPAKVVGRYLSPFLAAHMELALAAPGSAGA